jgi:hypothetical protein
MHAVNDMGKSVGRLEQLRRFLGLRQVRLQTDDIVFVSCWCFGESHVREDKPGVGCSWIFDDLVCELFYIQWSAFACR